MSDTPTNPEGADLYGVVVQLGASVEGLRADLAEEQQERAEAQRAIAAAERAIAVTEVRVETDRRTHRRSNMAIAAAGLILLLGILAQWRQTVTRDHDRTDAAVTNCVNGNVAREKLVGYTNDRVDKRIYSLLDVVFAISGAAAATPEQAAQRAVARDKIKADFAAEPAVVPAELGPRDCSAKAVSSPTTITTAATTTGP